MLLDKLKALEASPGPWGAKGPVDEAHAKKLEAIDACTCWVFDIESDEVATFDAHGLRQNHANAKLAALAPHIPKLVEALSCERTGRSTYDTEKGTTCLERESAALFTCPPCTVLAELEDALDA